MICILITYTAEAHMIEILTNRKQCWEHICEVWPLSILFLFIATDVVYSLFDCALTGAQRYEKQFSSSREDMAIEAKHSLGLFDIIISWNVFSSGEYLSKTRSKVLFYFLFFCTSQAMMCRDLNSLRCAPLSPEFQLHTCNMTLYEDDEWLVRSADSEYPFICSDYFRNICPIFKKKITERTYALLSCALRIAEYVNPMHFSRCG